MIVPLRNICRSNGRQPSGCYSKSSTSASPNGRTSCKRSSAERWSWYYLQTGTGVVWVLEPLKKGDGIAIWRQSSVQMELDNSSILPISTLWPIPYPISSATSTIFFLELVPLRFGFQQNWDILQNDKLSIGNMMPYDEHEKPLDFRDSLHSCTHTQIAS